MYSSAPCHTDENEEYEQQEPQDPQDATTSPLAAAAGGVSARRRSSQPQVVPSSSQPQAASSSSHPALVSAMLLTISFELDDDLAMSNIGGVIDMLSSSSHEKKQPSTSTEADRHRADMTNVVRIIDQALDVLKSGDEYSLNDGPFDLS